MVTLTENEYLTPKHLDLLWGVIEKARSQEDTCFIVCFCWWCRVAAAWHSVVVLMFQLGTGALARCIPSWSMLHKDSISKQFLLQT